MAEDAASIVGKIFEEASVEESLKFVAEPLHGLWSEGKWNADTIRDELHKIAEGVMAEASE